MHSTFSRMTTLAVVCSVSWLAGACGRSEAPPPPAPQASTPAPPPMPELGLYVTNETEGTLTVIDVATLTPVTTIPLGKRPRGIAASPDGTRLYVALSGSPNAGPGVDEKKLPPPDRSADGIGIVDLQLGKLLKVLPSGTDPEQLAVSTDGTRVFIANEDSGKASVVDVSSGQIVETFKIGDEPEGVVGRAVERPRLGDVGGRRGRLRHRRGGPQGGEGGEGGTTAALGGLSARRIARIRAV